MNYKTSTGSNTVKKNTSDRKKTARKISSRNAASKNTTYRAKATKSSNSRSSINKNTATKKSTYNRQKNTHIHSNIQSKKRKKGLNPRKNIRRTIPHKTKSPKINKNIAPTTKPKQMDYAIFFTVIMLVIFGIVMIFSASYYRGIVKFDDKYYFLKRQCAWAVLGFFALMFMTFFDYRKFKRFAIPMYIVANILLVLVFIMGVATNGAKRWIFGFQPSEPAKIAVIMFLAYIIDKNPKLVTTWTGFIKTIIFLGITTMLIAYENLSTGIVVGAIGCVIIFIAGAKIMYFMPMVIPAGAVGVLLFTGKGAYRLDRIKVWLDPFSDPMGGGFQIIQSLYAIGSGGLFGRGLGNSIQKLGYIPESYNDIIFSVVCEELGLIGAGGLILLFILLISRGIRTALRSRDLFASLVAIGIISMIAVQAIINIAVVTNTIPNTGMPLPFVSYGGSSLVVFMTSVGILLNISCYTKS